MLLRSWIRENGTLSVLLAAVNARPEELLVKERPTVWMIAKVFCTVACLLVATTIFRPGSSQEAAHIANVNPEPTAVPPAKVPKLRKYTLTRLVTGVSWLHRTRAARKDEAWASVAGFRVTEKGKPAPWEPVDIAVTDGKGKKWRWVGGGNKHDGDQILHLFLLDPFDGKGYRDQIRPDNCEWHLRVEFSRTSGFGAADLWTVRNVPVPQEGQTIDYKVIASTVLHGTKIDLQQLLPPSESFGEPIDKFNPVPINTPAVIIVHSPRREGLRMDLVKVMDDQGRKVTTSFISGRPGREEGGDRIDRTDPQYQSYFRLVGLRPDAKSVNLMFALHESEYAEFDAKPKVIEK